MRPLILTDLDDTLFQTMRKCPEEEGDLKAMSTLVDGSPSGFATTRQQNFLSWLRHGRVVPVTARSSKVLARVDIEQEPAIVANGGAIRVAGGGFDQGWHNQLVALAAEGMTVAEAYEKVTACFKTPGLFRHWIVKENRLALYIVIKSESGNGNGLDMASAEARELLPREWRIHLNDNNLALLPPWVNKRHAAAHMIATVRDEVPGTPIIGVGDSTSDVGFMDLCDFAVTPTRSQLWRTVIADNAWVEDRS